MFVLINVLGFWSSQTTNTPVISIPITPNGGTFAKWDEEDGIGDGWHPNTCNWWNGTYYYDTGVCNAFSITRVSSSDVDHALRRAQHCMTTTRGESECVLNGEIGFAVPSVFLYDNENAEMRMLIAPRYIASQDSAPAKMVRMQDPRVSTDHGDETHVSLHPNQIFEFNGTVTVEYLKGGARTMATESLEGQAAYCVQALRRSIAPACWEALD